MYGGKDGEEEKIRTVHSTKAKVTGPHRDTLLRKKTFGSLQPVRHRNDVQVLQPERRAENARNASATETAARATAKPEWPHAQCVVSARRAVRCAVLHLCALCE